MLISLRLLNIYFTSNVARTIKYAVYLIMLQLIQDTSSLVILKYLCNLLNKEYWHIHNPKIGCVLVPQLIALIH